MRILSLILLILSLHTAYGQRTILKEVDASQMEELVVLPNEVSLLNITTNTQNKVIVTAIIAGEFASDIVIELDNNSPEWQLTTGYRPGYEPKDDKLSAHKVMSIELEISMPQQKDLFIGSVEASVSLTGTYNMAELLLVDGSINLESYYGAGVLKTMFGNINGSLLAGVQVNATAPKGTVVNQFTAIGLVELELMANRGDITLTKAKN